MESWIFQFQSIASHRICFSCTHGSSEAMQAPPQLWDGPVYDAAVRQHKACIGRGMELNILIKLPSPFPTLRCTRLSFYPDIGYGY